MRDEIELFNRYGEDNKLVRVSGNLYKLVLNTYDYVRYGLADGHKWEDNEYYFVDPPGGPFISVGGEIDGMVVKRIYRENKNTLIEFENEK